MKREKKMTTSIPTPHRRPAGAPRALSEDELVGVAGGSIIGDIVGSVAKAVVPITIDLVSPDQLVTGRPAGPARLLTR